MNMKIDGQIDTKLLDKTSKAGGKAKSTVDSAPEAGFSTSEKTSISSLSGQLKEAPIDSKKVDAIKQAIRDGKFNVDSNAVAEGLIKSTKQLLNIE
jgi:negative regulator of flagellin synthesis FlgM